jgi:hypothetical protein
MQKISLCDVKSYDAPGHFGMTAMRLHAKEETGASKFGWVCLIFCPAGISDISGPRELIDQGEIVAALRPLTSLSTLC